MKSLQVSMSIGLYVIFSSTSRSVGFVPHLNVAVLHRPCLQTKHDVYLITQMIKLSSEFDEDDDEDYEYARLRRGRYGKFVNDDEDRASGSTPSGTRKRKEYPFNDQEEDDYEFDAYDSDYDDEYDDESDEDDDFDDIIPNPLLDQIDPDGAIERLPELFSDPQFWRDSAIWFFIAFLCLLGRFNNPMLNGIVDLDKVDFNQLYAK